MLFRFRVFVIGFKAWQKSYDFCLKAYRITATFPKDDPGSYPTFLEKNLKIIRVAMETKKLPGATPGSFFLPVYQCWRFDVDGFAKSLKTPFDVIPAKAGIQ